MNGGGIVDTWSRESSEELLESVEEEMKLADSVRGGRGKSMKGVNGWIKKDFLRRADSSCKC